MNYGLRIARCDYGVNLSGVCPSTRQFARIDVPSRKGRRQVDDPALKLPGLAAGQDELEIVGEPPKANRLLGSIDDTRKGTTLALPF